jgi:hypothetical protein
MSASETTKSNLSATKAPVPPQAGEDEAPAIWPSVVGSGAAAYVSHPDPKDGADMENGAEG